jgi:ankyrin repeat protein
MKKSFAPNVSPQSYFDAMVQSRGYCTKRYATLTSSYSNEPTELQLASYDKHLIDRVRYDRVDEFSSILAQGISPNPVNGYGESILHLICQRGSVKFLRLLIEHGCDVQVADRFGRTAVHEACFSSKPNFKLVEMLLRIEPRMMTLTDCRGATPLSYVSKSHWAAWLQFLESVKEDFWPFRDVKNHGPQDPPERVLHPSNSRPVVDPPNAPSLDLARKIASGMAT